jgi:LacI family transcriptional regulator
MTLQEVARRAKVSPATVSRVLNNSAAVKQPARARVLKAVAELNYHPNLHARTLARGRSHTLGLIVSNLRNPFFLDVFQALSADAHEKGFEVIVASTDYRPEQLLTHTRLMLGRRVAGLAVIVSEMDPTVLHEVRQSRTPVVFYDVGVAAGNTARIWADYGRGMRRVVEYLCSLGHRELAFVGHHTALAPLHVRQSAFLEAVRECSAEARYSTAAAEDSPFGGERAAHRLLASGARPTAIVCVNDFMALGVLKALRAMKLAVPAEVSVVGCDDISLAAFTCPPLTTVNIPRERIGRLVSEALILGREESSVLGHEIRIEPELIVRDSTAPPPGPRELARGLESGGAA